MCIVILKGCISTSRQKESSAGLDGEPARNMSGDLSHGLSEPEDSLPGSQTMQRKPPANKPTMKDKQKMRIVCQICYTGDTLLNYQWNTNFSQSGEVNVTHTLECHGWDVVYLLVGSSMFTLLATVLSWIKLMRRQWRTSVKHLSGEMRVTYGQLLRIGFYPS